MNVYVITSVNTYGETNVISVWGSEEKCLTELARLRDNPDSDAVEYCTLPLNESANT